MDQVPFLIRYHAFVYTLIFLTHPNTWLIACVQPPSNPSIKFGKGGGGGAGHIRYCVIPLQVPLLFAFTQDFHFDNTLRLKTALPRTFVQEHCSSTFTQTLHWRMKRRFFWSFNDCRIQRCCDTGCGDTPTEFIRRIHKRGATRDVFIYYCKRKFFRKVNKQIIKLRKKTFAFLLSLYSPIKCLLKTRSTPVGSHPYCIILGWMTYGDF